MLFKKYISLNKNAEETEKAVEGQEPEKKEESVVQQPAPEVPETVTCKICKKELAPQLRRQQLTAAEVHAYLMSAMNVAIISVYVQRTVSKWLQTQATLRTGSKRKRRAIL